MGDFTPPPCVSYAWTGTGEQNPLLKLVDTLINKTQGYCEAQLDIPEIIVVGDQSNGKSSLLQALCRKALFPTAEGMCTKAACRLQFHPYNEASWVSKCKELESLGLEGIRQEGFFVFFPQLPGSPAHEYHGRVFCTVDEISNWINFLTEDFLQMEGKRNGRNVTKHEILLELHAPNLPHLTLVDLPGLVSNSYSDQRQLARDIEQLVDDRAQNRRCILLGVYNAAADPLTQTAPGKVHGIDPEGERSVHVFTKTDRRLFQNVNQYSRVMETKGNKAPIFFSKLYVETPTPTNPQAHLQGILEEEKMFFEQPQFTGLEDVCGTDGLRNELERLLLRKITDSLDDLFMDFVRLHKAAKTDLAELGPAVANPDWQCRELSKRFRKRFKELVFGSKRKTVTPLPIREHVAALVAKVKEQIPILASERHLPNSKIEALMRGMAPLHNRNVSVESILGILIPEVLGEDNKVLIGWVDLTLTSISTNELVWAQNDLLRATTQILKGDPVTPATTTTPATSKTTPKHSLYPNAPENVITGTNANTQTTGGNAWNLLGYIPYYGGVSSQPGQPSKNGESRSSAAKRGLQSSHATSSWVDEGRGSNNDTGSPIPSSNGGYVGFQGYPKFQEKWKAKAGAVIRQQQCEAMRALCCTMQCLLVLYHEEGVPSLINNTQPDTIRQDLLLRYLLSPCFMGTLTTMLQKTIVFFMTYDLKRKLKCAFEEIMQNGNEVKKLMEEDDSRRRRRAKVERDIAIYEDCLSEFGLVDGIFVDKMREESLFTASALAERKLGKGP